MVKHSTIEEGSRPHSSARLSPSSIVKLPPGPPNTPNESRDISAHSGYGLTALEALSGVRPTDGEFAAPDLSEKTVTRDRPRLLVQPVHAIVLILLLIGALCTSLTLFIQQAHNYAQIDGHLSQGSASYQTRKSSGRTSSSAKPSAAEPGQQSPKSMGHSGQGAAPTTPSPAPAAPQLVDVNTASLQELESVNGIGPVMAQRIVDYRQSHGPFTSVEQLQQVSGIGPKTLEKLRSKLRVT